MNTANKWLIIKDDMSDKELAKMYADMESLAEEVPFVPNNKDDNIVKPVAS